MTSGARRSSPRRNQSQTRGCSATRRHEKRWHVARGERSEALAKLVASLSAFVISKEKRARSRAASRALPRAPAPHVAHDGRHAHLPRHAPRAHQGSRRLLPRVPRGGGPRRRRRRRVQGDERHEAEHREQPRRRDDEEHRRQGVHHHGQGRRGHGEGQVRAGVPRAREQGGHHRGGPLQLRRRRQHHVRRGHEPRPHPRPGHGLPGAHRAHQRPRRDGRYRRRPRRRAHGHSVGAQLFSVGGFFSAIFVAALTTAASCAPSPSTR